MKEILLQFQPDERKRFMGNRAALKAFFSDADCRYMVVDSLAGDHAACAANWRDAAKKLRSAGIKCIKVNMNAFEAELLFPGLRDKEGIAFDLTIRAALRICDPPSAALYFLPALSMNRRVDAGDVARLIHGDILQSVTAACAERTYDYLGRKDGYPPSWWLSRLNEWMALSCAEFTGVETAYSSPDLQRLRQIQDQKKEYDMTEAQMRMAKEARLRAQAIDQEFLCKEADIKSMSDISRMEREARLEEIQQKREINRLQNEREQERIRLEILQMRTESQGMAAAENHPPREEIEQSRRQVERLEHAVSQLERKLDAMPSAMNLVKDTESPALYADRICDEAAEITADTYRLSGQEESCRYLSRMLRETGKASRHGVSFTAAGMHRRDVKMRPTGGQSAGVYALRLNQRLDFSLESQTDGCLTILCVGTSGRVYIMAPNPYTPPEACTVKRNVRYHFPDERIFRAEIIEAGPAGAWEEFFAIVSQRPVIPRRLMDRIRRTNTDGFTGGELIDFAELSGDDLDGFLESLDTFGPGELSVGSLCFYVEK